MKAGWRMGPLYMLQKGLYNLITYLVSLLMLPVWLIKDARTGGGTWSRYGIIPVEVRRAVDPFGCLWMHAASVGEVGVLARVLPRLAELTPELPVVVTTVTSTGRDRARQLLGDSAHLLYLPLDAPVFVRRTIRTLHPQVMVIAETELWPNLVKQAAFYGAPVVLINGRLSARALKRYRLAGTGMRPLLRALSILCVKSEVDRDRFISLGADPNAVHITGDLKYEPLPTVVEAPVETRRDQLGLPAERTIFTAGSTRQGEESQVLDSFRGVLQNFPDALLVLAPRYPHRADEVEELISGSGLSCLRRRDHLGGAATDGIQVLLLDTIGELERFYAASDLAFVGGSLVPVGGHNLLEPALYGVPVLFGPHTDKTAGADELLIEAGGGRRVMDSGELSRSAVELFGDDSARFDMGGAARQAVLLGRGALEGIVHYYRRSLGLVISPGRAVRTDRGSRGLRADELSGFQDESGIP